MDVQGAHGFAPGAQELHVSCLGDEATRRDSEWFSVSQWGEQSGIAQSVRGVECRMNGEGRQETSKETTAMIWGYEIPTLGKKNNREEGTDCRDIDKLKAHLVLSGWRAKEKEVCLQLSGFCLNDREIMPSLYGRRKKEQLSCMDKCGETSF